VGRENPLRLFDGLETIGFIARSNFLELVGAPAPQDPQENASTTAAQTNSLK